MKELVHRFDHFIIKDKNAQQKNNGTKNAFFNIIIKDVDCNHSFTWNKLLRP